MIAALYVETDGVYFGLEDVDPWDADRDARNYAPIRSRGSATGCPARSAAAGLKRSMIPA